MWIRPRDARRSAALTFDRPFEIVRAQADVVASRKNTQGVGMARNIDLRSPEKEAYNVGGKTVKVGNWYRGENTNFGPKMAQIGGADTATRYVLQGWLPKEKFIDHETKVVAFGSCFAQNITKWLARQNYNVLTDKEGSSSSAYVIRFGEGLVNTFVILQQFEWALEGKTFNQALWHGYEAEEYDYDEKVREDTRQLFLGADVFIITLGLSEIWYDEVTKDVFWRAVPTDKFDPERHKFRVSTVAENKANINKIIALIRKHRPSAKIIFTLSPIPLVATFRAQSCISSSFVSKAVLRSALDEVLREQDMPDTLFYWPSYEIVLDLFDNRWRPDRRHVKQEILDFIMTLFEVSWCQGSQPRMSLDMAWLKARIATGVFPSDLLENLTARKKRRVLLSVLAHEPALSRNDMEVIKAVSAELGVEWSKGVFRADETEDAADGEEAAEARPLRARRKRAARIAAEETAEE